MNLTHSFYRVYQSVYKVAMGALDWTPPELLQGAGTIKKLPALVKKQGVSNVLIVTDKGLMGLHLLDSLFEGLKSEGIKYTVFDGVQPNPTIYNVEDALKLYHDNGCEAFIVSVAVHQWTVQRLLRQRLQDLISQSHQCVVS